MFHRTKNLFWSGLSILFFSYSPIAIAGGHFVIEPFSGVTFHHGYNMENSVGLESGVLFGIGGKLKGFPPRFFFYCRVSQSMFGEDEVFVDSRQASASVRRSYTQLSGGLRVILPLVSKLRLNLEVGGGNLFTSNKASESGILLARYDEDLAVMELGIGLNYRFFNWLSLGLMYNYSFLVEDDRGDAIAAMLGEADLGSNLAWSRWTATVGFHF
jgi:hypothetical protein